MARGLHGTGLMMTKSRASFAFLALAGAIVLGVPRTAQAQQGSPNSNCPPGSWFCGDAQAGGGAGAGASAQGGAGAQAGGQAGANGQLQPLPGDGKAGAAGAGQTPAAPPVVVYQPAPPPVVVVQGRAEAPPPYHYQPRPPAPRRSEWGINLRLEGALIGSGNANNAGMGGLGLGVRFRPVPVVAVEGDLDFVGGKDYNGNSRGESAFTLNCLLFVNPKSRAQVYFLGGFGWSAARVTDETHTNTGYFDRELHYSYFGMQGGIGLEFRVAKHFALNLALLGFMRGRTDSDARYQPEFVDPGTGRTTNTSGGGLLQGGMTFYF